MMESQFLRIAGELGWDLDRQIAKLAEFVAAAGREAAWEDYIAGRRPQGAALRDALLRFVAESGYGGPFTRFMLGHCQPTRRTAPQSAAPAPAPEPAAPSAAKRRPGFMGWLKRKGSHAAG